MCNFWNLGPWPSWFLSRTSRPMGLLFILSTSVSPISDPDVCPLYQILICVLYIRSWSMSPISDPDLCPLYQILMSPWRPSVPISRTLTWLTRRRAGTSPVLCISGSQAPGPAVCWRNQEVRQSGSMSGSISVSMSGVFCSIFEKVPQIKCLRKKIWLKLNIISLLI